jgi:DNA-directed RNA polymerase subunit RPC12/RpoP
VISCPMCQSKRIHPSKRKGILEQVILAMIFIKPYRCEKCDNRFFHRSPSSSRHASRSTTTS